MRCWLALFTCFLALRGVQRAVANTHDDRDDHTALVDSVDAFSESIAGGKKYIVVVQHLSFALADSDERLLYALPTSVSAIAGACSGAPKGNTPVLQQPLERAQCVLHVEQRFLAIGGNMPKRSKRADAIVLERLYIVRSLNTAEAGASRAAADWSRYSLFVLPRSAVWLKGVTFQGDGRAWGAMEVFKDAFVYAEKVTFVGLGMPEESFGPGIVSRGFVSLVDSVFLSCVASNPDAGIVNLFDKAKLRMENTYFVSSQGNRVMVQSDTVEVFSDNGLESMFVFDSNEDDKMEPLEEVPEGAFLQPSDRFYVDTQQELATSVPPGALSAPTAPPRNVPSGPDASLSESAAGKIQEEDGKRRSGAGTIAGITISLIVLLVVAAAAVLIWRGRRRQEDGLEPDYTMRDAMNQMLASSQWTTHTVGRTVGDTTGYGATKNVRGWPTSWSPPEETTFTVVTESHPSQPPSPNRKSAHGSHASLFWASNNVARPYGDASTPQSFEDDVSKTPGEGATWDLQQTEKAGGNSDKLMQRESTLQPEDSHLQIEMHVTMDYSTVQAHETDAATCGDTLVKCSAADLGTTMAETPRAGLTAMETAMSNLGTFRTVEEPRPPPDRARKQAALRQMAVRWLQDTFDAMYESSELFMGKYRVLGAHERRTGGQALVQFVVDPSSRQEFAVKCFTDYDAFTAECELYNVPALREMMPKAHEIVSNENGRVKRSDGESFPPFIVVERGESLNEFAANVQHEPITVIQAIVLVAGRLRHLHEANWVHRDLKPPNILRLPKQHSWTLIDFGAAARDGVTSPIKFSWAYVAPEVVRAVDAGLTSMRARKEMDIWSLGLIAFELLTQTRVFPKGCTQEQITSQLVGKAPFPWEVPGNREPLLRKLGRLEPTIMSCLDRDAYNRPTAESLLQSLNEVFAPQ